MLHSLEPFSDVPMDFSTVLETVRNAAGEEHLEPGFKYPASVADLIEQLSGYGIVRCDGQHRNLEYTFHRCDLRLKNVVCGHTYSLWRLIEMAEMLTGYKSSLLNPDGQSRMSGLLMRTRWAIEGCVHREMKKGVNRKELETLQDSYGAQIMEEIQYLIEQLKHLNN